MSKGHFHNVLSLLFIGFALIIVTTVRVPAQIQPLLRKDMPSNVRCYPREEFGFPVVPDEKKMPFGFEGYNALEDETQKIFHMVSKYTDLNVKVYTVPIKKNPSVPAAAICPAND